MAKVPHPDNGGNPQRLGIRATNAYSRHMPDDTASEPSQEDLARELARTPSEPSQEELTQQRELAKVLQEVRMQELAETHAANMRNFFEWWEKRFGAKVREWRQARNWSQEELAKQLHEVGIEMHQTTVAKVERGTRQLRVSEAVALAHVMGMPVLSVFYGPGPDGESFSMATMRKQMEQADEDIRQTEERLDALYKSLTYHETSRASTANAINRAALEADRGRDVAKAEADRG